MRFEKLDLNLLVTLESLLDTKSVTVTADKLNVSQPTISAALRRLREYFDDELLIQTGRLMLPTPKGMEIAPAVKELLNIARFKIVQSESFDPLTSSRCFKVITSDYAFDVLLAKVIANISKLAPNVQFEILPIAAETIRQFTNGNIDLLITVKQFILEEHLHTELFNDVDTVISCKQGQYANGVSADEFKNADFAAAVFGQERRPSVSELHFNAMGMQRNIAVKVSSFSALPATIVGTNRLAIIHHRHAEFFKSRYPISLNDLPIEGPNIQQIAQWHRLRENDNGLRWMLEQIQKVARTMT